MPSAMPIMCVMSQPWMKKVLLMKASQKRSLGMTMSHSVMFEGGAKRFVLAGAIQAVADSLDESSFKMSRYYNEAADNMGEVHRISRQILSKNADHIWRTVSHLFPNEKNKLVAPELWKGQMIEAVMSKRFPSEQRIRDLKLTYSIYTTSDTHGVLGGKRQRPYPGLVKDCSNLSRALQNNTEDMVTRLGNRILPLVKEFPSKGIYTMTLNFLRRDFLWLRAYNPVPIEGYDLLGRVAHLESTVNSVDLFNFRYHQPVRQAVADEVNELAKFVSGPFKEARREKYLELFGPTT